MMPYHSCDAELLYQYIQYKRAYGLKFKAEYMLKQLDDFFYVIGTSNIGITRDQAELWCTKRPNENPVNHAARIGHMNQFSRYLNDMGYTSYVPHSVRCNSTYTPYIFSKLEMKQIFEAIDTETTASIDCRSHAHLFPIVIRLLYSTGIRIGELIRLLVSDVDIEKGTILIRDSKNGRDRLLPVSRSMNTILRDYAARYNTAKHPHDWFFTRRDGKACACFSIYTRFRHILEKVGISHRGRGFGPRLHDVRHSFSVHSMAAMTETGLDIYFVLPLLSKYLGHSSLSSTEKYVRLTEEMFPGIISEANTIAPSIFPEVPHE